MKLCTLYSGSRGNAAYLECGGARILIDAGKCAKQLLAALTSVGASIEDIDAILITHEHNDHISALERPKNIPDIPIHIAGRSAEALRYRHSDYIKNNMVPHPPVYTLEVKDVRVSAFATPHDSAGSVGFRIEWEENGVTHRVGYATDVGYVTDDVLAGLSGCEAVVIEANHDVDMLKNGPYPYQTKLRILSPRGHLSNAACAELAVTLAGSGTRAFLLAHISEKNNDPALAYDEVFSALSDPQIQLLVANTHTPTKLVWEE